MFIDFFSVILRSKATKNLRIDPSPPTSAKLWRVRMTMILSCYLFLVTSFANAAELYFGSQSREVDVGAVIEVGVFVNSEDESVNAYEGQVLYPADLLEFKGVQDADSIISLWVERPKASMDQTGLGIISFAGITPGGYTGVRGYLFSVLFETKQEGQARIETSHDRVLLNDGEGTAAKLRRAPMTITIKEGVVTPPFLLPTDTTPPEPFTPVVSKDPTIFEGQWFVSFLTQDKQSGMDHYELKEQLPWWSFGRLFEQETWGRVVSPARLADQELRHDLSVRAVDRAGNIREARVSAAHPPAWYENYVLWGILILILATATVAGRRIWRRRKH
jgi:hypothetical protein